jgi:peptide/nickel transport system ATP-binding protein
MTGRTPGDTLLEMRNLRVEGDSGGSWREIVCGVDLVLKRGEILGLIGESGAGKSTIGLAAMGFARDGCRFSGGEVVFDGADILKLDDAARRRLRGSRIAYVAQSAAAAFNPAHNLIDQCVEVPVHHRLMERAPATAIANELFRLTRLPDPQRIGFRYPHQVSGGQLQRVMTAMAMVCRPDLIVFDEPTTALDVTTQVEVLVVIRELVEKFGTAALYISHDLAVVAQMADRIMVLRNGRLVEQGTTARLLTDAREPYTRELITARTLARSETPPPAAEPPLLQIETMTAAYGSLPVIFDAELSVPRGRTVAIVGESGSGKSTLARVITGLLPPRQGRVLWAGRALPSSYRNRSKADLRRIQLIYQMPDTSLNPHQRVREILGRPLAFYAGLTGPRQEARIRELLVMIELDPDTYIDRLPGELSGGQKQRICIARALAAEPDLIICDEVTSALDQLVADSILKLLTRLQREMDLTYLVITHDITVVRAIADEVVVMRQGRIVERGAQQTVLAAPRHPYTEILLSSAPELRTEWLTEVRAQHAERHAAMMHLATE